MNQKLFHYRKRRMLPLFKKHEKKESWCRKGVPSNITHRSHAFLLSFFFLITFKNPSTRSSRSQQTILSSSNPHHRWSPHPVLQLLLILNSKELQRHLHTHRFTCKPPATTTSSWSSDSSRSWSTDRTTMCATSERSTQQFLFKSTITNTRRRTVIHCVPFPPWSINMRQNSSLARTIITQLCSKSSQIVSKPTSDLLHQLMTLDSNQFFNTWTQDFNLYQYPPLSTNFSRNNVH